MKNIAILTPNLRQRDGISAHSINLITDWLEAGMCVQVFNLGRFGLEFEVELIGIESLENHLRKTEKRKKKKILENNFNVMVVQYAISSYWFRILLLNRYLASKQEIKFHLMCHEPVREMLILKYFGRYIYKSALAKSSKAFVFSSEAFNCLNALTKTQVTRISLRVPKKNKSNGSGQSYPSFLLMGYYLKDKGFERGFQAFVDAYVETKVPIALTIVVSTRQRSGSARLFAPRDRKNLRDFRKLVFTFQERFPGVIEWNDFMPIEKLEKIIERSDFLLLPYSVITNSGVAVNAKAQGIPVICSNLPPLSEALGNYGIYVSDGSIKSWSKVIQELILNPNWMLLREKISKGVYSTSGNRFVENESQMVAGE